MIRDRIEATFNKINDDNQKVQFLRAKLINHLINRVSSVFMERKMIC